MPDTGDEPGAPAAPDSGRTVDALKRGGFLVPSATRPGWLLPRDPTLVIAEEIDRRVTDLWQRREHLDELREVLRASERLGSDRAETGDVDTTAEVIVERADALTRLGAVLAASTTEIVCVQAGGAKSPEDLARKLPHDLDLLARGVRVQLLYQHAACRDTATRRYIDRLIEAGAEVRTTDFLSGSLVVVDRRHVFTMNGTDGDEAAAVLVSSPAAGQFMIEFVSGLWTSARTVAGTARDGSPAEEADLRQDILALMAEGHTDDSVSRQLGISTRTCRRHVARAMAELGAVSRFQAGVHAARAGLLAE